MSQIPRKFRERSWGSKLREKFHKFATLVHPYISIIIPNFKAAHYSYVVMWAIIGSIFIYPIRNMPYIDALFFATGSSTQSGLNTIDVNVLSLWQQMSLYIISTFTTPIFIHGSLLFIRLYSFERFFDNIKQTSKLNNQMRRTATLGSRSRSFDSVGVNTMANTGYNLNLGNYNTQQNTQQNTNSSIPLVTLNSKNDEVSVTDEHKGSPPSSSTQDGSIYGEERHLDPEVDHFSEPSDEDDPVHRGQHRFERAASPSDIQDIRPHIQFPVNLQHPAHNTGHGAQGGHASAQGAQLGGGRSSPKRSSPGRSSPKPQIQAPSPTHDHTPIGGGGIRFGNLPSPTKRDYEVAPSEMYRSIELLQQSKDNADDDDEVLIIKSPNQIENEDESHPIFTKRGSGQPLRTKFKKTVKSKLKKMRTMSMNSIEDETNSIDSNDVTGIDNTIDEDDHKGVSGGISGGVSGDDESVNSEDNDYSDYDEDDQDNDGQDMPMGRAQSHLGLPNEAGQTDGQKYTKRANTFDGRTPKFSEPATKPQRQKRKKFNLTPKVSRNSVDEEASIFTTLSRSMSRTLTSQLTRSKTANYLSWEPTIGRNSNFVHLTEEQKEELGGVEYRAIKLLIKIVCIYYVGWHIIALLVYLGWILNQPEHQAQLHGYGISPVWWGLFTAQSMFNDSGFTLTPNSMIDYNKSIYVLLWGAFFIIIGNTGFPIFLRFIIWVLYKFAKPLSLYEESLAFLLDHPRRCFTLLFPSGPTWWLFAILIILNGIDLIFFIILDLHNSYLEAIPTNYRVLCGFFNAVSTRTAGLSAIDLSELHTAVQVSYLIMMYISVLPIAISIRRTNVYEEQSLGVYIKDQNLNHQDDNEKSPSNFIGNHLRNQLSFDLWFVFLGLFIICIAENSKLDNKDIRFTAFTILFECVSAYGTVGLSLGYPTVNTSLVGKFTVISKLVLIAMMIRGRHRGLPYSLDRAILLPNEDMARRDEVQENHAIRRNETLERAHTMASGTGHDLFQALSRRGNEFLRRRSTVASRPRSE